MLKIRLQRTGRNNEKTFRLVLTDSKNSTKSGRFLEILGNHDFRNTNTAINGERVKFLISKGAKTTSTVHNLLLAQKIIDGRKINVLPRKSPPKKEGEAAAPATAAVAPAPVQA
jgi:small subunit ribosomal protein S16